MALKAPDDFVLKPQREGGGGGSLRWPSRSTSSRSPTSLLAGNNYFGEQLAKVGAAPPKGARWRQC
jgi:hypothetical protein